MNWYYFQDEQYMHGPYETREEAIEEGKFHYEDLSFWVQAADEQQWDLSMEGYDIVNTLEGQNEDLMGEDGDFLGETAAQRKDLGEMVTAAIHAWVEKHNISTKAWALDVQGKPELIEGEHQ